MLQSMLGYWRSSTYGPNTTVTVIRLNNGTIQVSWGVGGQGPLTQEGNMLRVRQTVPASTYNVVANVSDVSSGRIVWKRASDGGYDDTWKKIE